MKAIKLLAFSIIAFSFWGCDDELFDLKLNMPTIEVKYTLKATDTAGIIILDPISHKINLDSIALANGTDLNNVKSVKAKKITVYIESPATGNFDVLESGELNVSTGIQGDPDFDLLRIAEITNVPDGLNQLTITPDDVDIMKYAKKPTLTLSGKLFTSGPVIEDMVLKFVIETEVVFNPVKKK